jgi:hypothetical protein
MKRVFLQTLNLVYALACALGFASLAHAQVDAALSERVLSKSGTLAQLDALPPQFKANFEQGLTEQRETPFTRVEIKRLTDLADVSFAASKLRTGIIATVAQRLSAEQVAALDKWYESDLGKRMLALEAEAAKADQRQAMEAGAALLTKSPEARSALLRELVEATRAAEFVADLSINMAVAAAHNASVAAARAASRSATTTLKELRDSAMRDRAQAVTSMNDVLMIAYAKTYERANDDDLKAYIAHMKSSAGKELADAVIAAFDRAISSSANELSASLTATGTAPKR